MLEFNQLTDRVDQLSSDVQEIVRESKLATEERKEIWRQIGGMSHTIGYLLEDKSYRVLPHLLKRDHSIVIQDRPKKSLPGNSQEQIG